MKKIKILNKKTSAINEPATKAKGNNPIKYTENFFNIEFSIGLYITIFKK